MNNLHIFHFSFGDQTPYLKKLKRFGGPYFKDKTRVTQYLVRYKTKDNRYMIRWGKLKKKYSDFIKNAGNDPKIFVFSSHGTYKEQRLGRIPFVGFKCGVIFKTLPLIRNIFSLFSENCSPDAFILYVCSQMFNNTQSKVQELYNKQKIGKDMFFIGYTHDIRPAEHKEYLRILLKHLRTSNWKNFEHLIQLITDSEFAQKNIPMVFVLEGREDEPKDLLATPKSIF